MICCLNIIIVVIIIALCVCIGEHVLHIYSLGF